VNNGVGAATIIAADSRSVGGEDGMVTKPTVGVELRPRTVDVPLHIYPFTMA